MADAAKAAVTVNSGRNRLYEDISVQDTDDGRHGEEEQEQEEDEDEEDKEDEEK